MTKFVTYDNNSIYALGETAAEAIANARADACEPEADFNTAVVSDELAAYIEANGWDGARETFRVVGGEIIRTTND